MYIEKKYWPHYIGGTDDTLRLGDYLADKQKKEISLSEIFKDTGLDKLEWNFRTTDPYLAYQDREGIEYDFYYAIDLITDLAALLLECKMNESVNLCELFAHDLEAAVPNVRITATPEERKQLNMALMDFVSEPLAYDLSEMCPEEEMFETAKVCEEMRIELYQK